jgi:uncharacterized protein DUF4149
LGWLQTTARVVHFVLLSLWFGAGVFLIAAVAPTAFQIVPSRDVAGDLVAATLGWIDLFGLIAGPFLLLTLLLGWLPLQAPVRLRMVLIVLMTIATGVSGRWLTPAMIKLRESMGRRIEEVDPSDPLKLQFGQLHALSTGLMGLHVTLALILMVLAIIGATPKRKFGIEL